MTKQPHFEKALISVENICKAKIRLKNITRHTPLMHNHHLSEAYQCNLYLKREDLQVVRSYKIRGAYNKMCQIPRAELDNGVVCASALVRSLAVAIVSNWPVVTADPICCDSIC